MDCHQRRFCRLRRQTDYWRLFISTEWRLPLTAYILSGDVWQPALLRKQILRHGIWPFFGHFHHRWRVILLNYNLNFWKEFAVQHHIAVHGVWHVSFLVAYGSPFIPGHEYLKKSLLPILLWFDPVISVKKILAVINATYAVAKRKPEKNQACRDSNPDLCDNGAAL